jgi:1-acyl-sn-glycerol-3-phosphate acyltransferase
MTRNLHRPRLLTWLLCGIGYTGYGIGMIVFLVAMLPFGLIMRPFFHRLSPQLSAVLHHSIRFLTRVYLPLLQVYRIKECSGFENLPSDRASIIVANHRGRLDGLLLLGTLKKSGAVMKSKYAATPFYGALVKNCNFVCVDPTSLTSLAQAIDRSREILTAGISLIIFPEGTRSASPRMLPFKDFAFKLALETDTAVAPVVIHSDVPFMAKIAGSYFPVRRFNYRIRCLNPVVSKAGETASDLAERVRRIMADELRALA